MNKAFLKSLAVFMVVCILVLTGGGFTVREVAINDGFTEIIVYDEIDCDKAQQIIATLNGDVLISPASVLCIFGHSMSQTTVIEINHRFWATSPRCRKTTHKVDFCTRNNCNYMVTTQLSQFRIQCCS